MNNAIPNEPIQIGIAEEHRQKISDELQKLLADEYLLYTKTRFCHWNVNGPSFHQLHVFFEGQYEQLDEIMDEVAERIRQLGHFAAGTLSAFLKLAHLQENVGYGDAKGMISTLLDDHETIIRSIRNIIDPINNDWKDAGTADFVTGLMEQHEKMAWMLRAHLA